MSDVAPRTARSARAEQTRLAIVAAAKAEFVSRGYRATSLRDIAAAAGISHPGLLRHFATKDEVLAEVVASIEQEPALHERAAREPRGPLWFGEVARRNERIPGFLALFAALMGEASTPTHPAHERMRRRYVTLLARSTDVLREAQADGFLAPERDPRAESVRIAAAWDGLQLLAQYLPDRVDVAASLEAHQSALASPRGRRDPGDAAPAADPAPVPPVPTFGVREAPIAAGYRVGRERRARILQDAMALFAIEGYGDTSLRDIAQRVGVSKAALLHHFPSKEDLLFSVLAERDRLVGSEPFYERAPRAADELRGIPRAVAHHTIHTAGLIELYAVLSCEAVPADHPAHAYFEDRYRRAVEYFASLFRAARSDGDLPAHRDPVFEAMWLVALWDGLQYQWLYDRSSIDIAEQLSAHLADVLPPR